MSWSMRRNLAITLLWAACFFFLGWCAGASHERKRTEAVVRVVRERFPETFQDRMVRYKGTWITLENLRWLAGDSTDFKDLEEFKP